MGAGDLLSHGGQEALGVEEAGHPEDGRPAFKHPGVELGITVQQVGEPEPECGRQPGYLKMSMEFLVILVQIRGWFPFNMV